MLEPLEEEDEDDLLEDDLLLPDLLELLEEFDELLPADFSIPADSDLSSSPEEEDVLRATPADRDLSSSALSAEVGAALSAEVGVLAFSIPADSDLSSSALSAGGGVADASPPDGVFLTVSYVVPSCSDLSSTDKLKKDDVCDELDLLEEDDELLPDWFALLEEEDVFELPFSPEEEDELLPDWLDLLEEEDELLPDLLDLLEEEDAFELESIPDDSDLSSSAVAADVFGFVSNPSLSSSAEALCSGDNFAISLSDFLWCSGNKFLNLGINDAPSPTGHLACTSAFFFKIGRGVGNGHLLL